MVEYVFFGPFRLLFRYLFRYLFHCLFCLFRLLLRLRKALPGNMSILRLRLIFPTLARDGPVGSRA
jgi:hypothetical protein